MALASPIADFVVALRDGTIVNQGSLSKALDQDAELSGERAKEAELIKTAAGADKEAGPTHDGGKLVVDEEIAEGHVSWSARQCTASCRANLPLTSLTCSESALWKHRIGRHPGPLLGPLRWLCVCHSAGYNPGNVGAESVGATIRIARPTGRLSTLVSTYHRV